HAFAAGGLHRIEVNIRPENAPSRRVVEKLGFRGEAYHPRYLHIAGAWRGPIRCFPTGGGVGAPGAAPGPWRRLRPPPAARAAVGRPRRARWGLALPVPSNHRVVIR